MRKWIINTLGVLFGFGKIYDFATEKDELLFRLRQRQHELVDKVESLKKKRGKKK